MSKLSRREAQLVRHARQRAVEEYKATTTFTLSVPQSETTLPKMKLIVMTLAQMENINQLNCSPPYFVDLCGPWRSAR